MGIVSVRVVVCRLISHNAWLCWIKNMALTVLPILRTVVVIVIRAGTVSTTIVVAMGVVMLVVSQMVVTYWEQNAAPKGSALMDDTASDRHEQLSAAATLKGKSGIKKRPRTAARTRDRTIVGMVRDTQGIQIGYEEDYGWT